MQFFSTKFKPITLTGKLVRIVCKVRKGQLAFEADIGLNGGEMEKHATAFLVFAARERKLSAPDLKISGATETKTDFSDKG